MAENVEAEVKEFISKNFIFEQELTPELSLTESGILDSMGVVSLVGHIETVFQIEVDDEDINQSNFGSVQKIVNYIESRLNG